MKKALLLSFWGFYAINATAQAKKDPLQRSVAAGKIVYQQVCNSCHQADGGGVPNMNPPLAGSSWVTGDKRVPINIVLNGLAQKINIDGDYYSNNMPAQSTLTDQQVADVLTFVRNSFGNKASAIKATDVKALRKKK